MKKTLRKSKTTERVTGRHSLHAVIICRHCIHWQGGFKPKDDNLKYAFCELTNLPSAGIRGGCVEHPIETHWAFGCNLGKADNDRHEPRAQARLGHD